MRSAIRRADAADAREHVIGVRCARTATGSAAAASVPETETETEVDPTEWAGSNWDFRVVGGPWPSLSTLPSLPDEGARAYVVQSGWVVWDADLMAGLRGRDLEVILVLTDGQNRGQAADVGNVLEYSEGHEGWPVAIDLSGEINRLAESEPCVVRVTSSPGPVRCIAPSEDEFWGSMEGD
jgi:hypothetical protein